MAEQKINNREFSVNDVLATDAIMLQARLMRIIGPAVETLPSMLATASTATDGDLSNEAKAALITAVASVFEKNDPETVQKLIVDIVSMASVKRQSGEVAPVIIDLDFAGDAGSIYPVMFFVLKTVLADFFTGALEAGKQMKLKAG